MYVLQRTIKAQLPTVSAEFVFIPCKRDGQVLYDMVRLMRFDYLFWLLLQNHLEPQKSFFFSRELATKVRCTVPLDVPVDGVLWVNWGVFRPVF